MIAHLSGVLIDKNPPRLIVEVGGVGYELMAPMSTFERLPEIGGRVRLWTHLRVQSDGLRLFGFATEEERKIFCELLRVSGVGPRTALAILSGLSAQELREILASGDERRLQKLPGIGKKTASRLLLELQGRFEVGTREASRCFLEAEEALKALGFQPKEIKKLLEGLSGDSAEALVREALLRVVR